MIRPPHLDAARIRHALGIKPESITTAEDVIAALAELKAKRDAMGIVTPSPFPPDAGPDERRAIARAALDELVRTRTPVGLAPWWER